MPDQHTRELERRWREGDQVAGAAWIKARRRAKAVSDEQVARAAALGDRAAVEASGVEAIDDPAGWLEALINTDVNAALRGAVAAARLLVPDWEAALVGNKRVRRIRSGLEAVEAWLLDPSADRSAAAERCQRRLLSEGTRGWLEADPGAHAAWTATTHILSAVAEAHAQPPSALVLHDCVTTAVRQASSVHSWETTVAAVRAEVTPYLLELSNPLADRVSARARHQRELEATWNRTGETGAAVALLRARLEAGEIERSALRLAAYLGHDAADQTLRGAGELPSAIPDDFEAWVLRSIAYGGLTAPVAAFLAIGRRVLPDSDDPALTATAAWITDPTSEHASACLAAAHAATRAARLIPAAVAAVNLDEHRERRSALARLLEPLLALATDRGLDPADLRRVVRDALTPGLLGLNW